MTPGLKQKERRKEAKQKKWKQVDISGPSGTGETSGRIDSAVDSQKTESPIALTPIESECDPQFRNKPISSNWDRYEEPVEDADIIYNKTKGEDFDLLLSSSTGASAHFRFKEQEDWQADLDIDEFLSVDCDVVAAALQTIPLHQRLNLPEAIFPPEILKNYVEEAAAHRQAYKSSEWCTRAEAGASPISKFSTRSARSKEEDDLTRLLATTFSQKLGRLLEDNSQKQAVDKEMEEHLSFLHSLTSKDLNPHKAEAQVTSKGAFVMPPSCAFQQAELTCSWQKHTG